MASLRPCPNPQSGDDAALHSDGGSEGCEWRLTRIIEVDHQVPWRGRPEVPVEEMRRPVEAAVRRGGSLARNACGPLKQQRAIERILPEPPEGTQPSRHPERRASDLQNCRS